MPRAPLTARKLDSLRATSERVDYWDDDPHGFGVRVTPDGKKTFCVMYRIAGRLRRMTIDEYPTCSLKDARETAKEALRQARKGIDPVEERRRKAETELAKRVEGFTVQALADRFLKEHVSGLRSEYEVRRIFKADLLPEFGRKKARELKRDEIRNFLERMAQRKPVMANRCLAHFRKMYNWAVSRDLVEYNPCIGISRPGREQQRDRVLTEDEIKAVWRALDEEKPIMAATFRLRLLTAQRGGEVHAIRWKDIDGDWWTIPAEVAKNGLSHRVPLSPQSMRILEQVRKVTELLDEKEGRKRSAWVFPNPIRRADHIDECQKLAQRVRKNSGVDFRAHDFRRTAASMMASMGVPRLVIGKILNHVEPGVTKVYDRHSYDPEKRQALDAWGARVARIVISLGVINRAEA